MGSSPAEISRQPDLPHSQPPSPEPVDVPPIPETRRDPAWRYVVLFLATVLTTTGVPSEAELPYACLHQLLWPVMDDDESAAWEHSLQVLRDAGEFLPI